LILTVKEKEKYVLKLREEGKTYRDIAYKLLISPREISRILKEASGEKETKERKKIVLSKTAQVLQFYKKGKSPTDVAIKLDLSTQEANSLYHNYLSLKNLHHFVQTFKEFGNDDSLQDFIDYYDFMKKNGITKEEIVEAIKISNDYPKVKGEYYDILEELKEINIQREFYISDNKLLRYNNWELNNKHDSLLSKVESANRMLQLIENEINKNKEMLGTTENSEEYTILKNKIEEQINDFLNQRKEFYELAVTTIIDIIKEDPDKEILINNILYPNENPQYGFFLISYEEKIARIADTLHNFILKNNTNNILHS
jgi:hypothetical protein